MSTSWMDDENMRIHELTNSHFTLNFVQLLPHPSTHLDKQ